MPKLAAKMEEIIAEQHYLPSEMASRDTLIRLQTIVAFRWSEIPNLICQTRC